MFRVGSGVGEVLFVWLIEGVWRVVFVVEKGVWCNYRLGLFFLE